MENQTFKNLESNSIMEKYELLYRVDKTKSHLRLLGGEFVEKNRLFGRFIYKSKKIPLIEKIGTQKIKSEELKINLIFYNIIFNKRFMFEDCEALLQVSIPNEKDDIKYSEIIDNSRENENYFDLYEENEEKNSENTLMKSLSEFEFLSSISEIPGKYTNYSNLSTIENVCDNLKKRLLINKIINIT